MQLRLTTDEYDLLPEARQWNFREAGGRRILRLGPGRCAGERAAELSSGHAGGGGLGRREDRALCLCRTASRHDQGTDDNDDESDVPHGCAHLLVSGPRARDWSPGCHSIAHVRRAGSHLLSRPGGRVLYPAAAGVGPDAAIEWHGNRAPRCTRAPAAQWKNPRNPARLSGAGVATERPQTRRTRMPP